MKLKELAYIVVGSQTIDDWSFFATQVVGAMTEGAAQGALYIKLDDWKYRILVLPHKEDRYLAAGWSVLDEQAYQASLDAVRASGVHVDEGTAEECAVRLVAAFFRFADPAGNVHEVCWGRTLSALPFRSSAGVAAFVTGDQGMGHVVLPCHGDYDGALEFYRRVMGLECSDYFVRQTGVGQPPRRAYFFHCDNPRQHSLALVDTREPRGLLHYMSEVTTLDEVGRALDRVVSSKFKLARTLGRHVNDSMISFYVVTPGGFQLEYGFGGERMDWSRHEVRQIAEGSYWGHVWQSTQ